MEYRSPHFQKELLAEDSGFSTGPRPGDPFPDFELPTTDGDHVRKADCLGRPLLVVFASSRTA